MCVFLCFDSSSVGAGSSGSRDGVSDTSPQAVLQQQQQQQAGVTSGREARKTTDASGKKALGVGAEGSIGGIGGQGLLESMDVFSLGCVIAEVFVFFLHLLFSIVCVCALVALAYAFFHPDFATGGCLSRVGGRDLCTILSVLWCQLCFVCKCRHLRPTRICLSVTCRPHCHGDTCSPLSVLGLHAPPSPAQLAETSVHLLFIAKISLAFVNLDLET